MAARRLQHRFVAAGLVMLVLVGTGWYLQHLRVSEANKLLAVEQAETSRLSGQAQTLVTIKAFVTGVDNQHKTVQTAMSREIYFSKVISGIRAATPSGTGLQTIAVTLAPETAPGAVPAAGAAAVCPGPDPFQTETVTGCVTLSGTAFSRADVGELVTNLGETGVFVEPFISTTTTGDSVAVSFSGSVGLSDKVFSGRYGPPTSAAVDTSTVAPTAGGMP